MAEEKVEQVAEDTVAEETVEDTVAEETVEDTVVVTDEIVQKEVAGVNEPRKNSTNEDIFITENDTFEASVEFFSENGELFVKSVDDDYDPEGKEVRSFTATFKYPSQSDLEKIMNNAAYKSPENLTMHDVIRLELVRMGILIRGWTLGQKMSRMAELDPKIIKGLMNGVRDAINLDGII